MVYQPELIRCLACYYPACPAKDGGVYVLEVHDGGFVGVLDQLPDRRGRATWPAVPVHIKPF